MLTSYYLKDKTLVLTNSICNLDCIFCPKVMFLKSERVGLKNINSMNFDTVEFNGGEWLQDPEFDNLLSLFEKKLIVLKTNLLECSKLFNILGKYKFSKIIIDISAFYDNFEILTNSEYSFDVFFRNFKDLLRVYKRDINICINVSKNTFRTIDLIALFNFMYGYLLGLNEDFNRFSFDIINYSDMLDSRNKEMLGYNYDELNSLFPQIYKDKLNINIS